MLDRIRNLFRNLAIYGFGDVATSIVSLLLLPIYTRYLTPSDYGVIAMLLTIEAVAKVLFRWGVDTAFMRLYYDCADQPARQRLASTIFFFLLAVNGSLLAVGLLGAGWLSTRLFGSAHEAILIALVIGNTFVVGLYFIPFQVLRIKEKSKQFIALVFARSAATLVLRLVLVIGAGMGVLGVVVADVVVTVFFTGVLSRWFAPLIRPVFSRPILREALRFGLPRIPHSVAHQVIGLADRYFLNAFGTLHDVGLYSIGASFGLALKLFVGAFEAAWTPFFLGVMREPNPQRVYATVSTYVVAVLVLLTAGLCAVARGCRTAHDDSRVPRGGARNALDRAGCHVPGRLYRRIDWARDHEAHGPLSACDGRGSCRQLAGERVADSPLWTHGRRMGEHTGVRDACGRNDHVLSAALSDSLRMESTVADRRGGSGRVRGEQSTRAGIPVTVAGNCAARSARYGNLPRGAVRDRVLSLRGVARASRYSEPGFVAAGPGTAAGRE